MRSGIYISADKRYTLKTEGELFNSFVDTTDNTTYELVDELEVANVQAAEQKFAEFLRKEVFGR